MSALEVSHAVAGVVGIEALTDGSVAIVIAYALAGAVGGTREAVHEKGESM